MNLKSWLMIAGVSVPVIFGEFIIVALTPPAVTRAEYERVAPGMTIGQVEAIIGVPGRELSSEVTAGNRRDVVQWINANGSLLNATFEQGKLVGKSAEQLK